VESEFRRELMKEKFKKNIFSVCLIKKIREKIIDEEAFKMKEFTLISQEQSFDYAENSESPVNKNIF